MLEIKQLKVHKLGTYRLNLMPLRGAKTLDLRAIKALKFSALFKNFCKFTLLKQ